MEIFDRACIENTLVHGPDVVFLDEVQITGDRIVGYRTLTNEDCALGPYGVLEMALQSTATYALRNLDRQKVAVLAGESTGCWHYMPLLQEGQHWQFICDLDEQKREGGKKLVRGYYNTRMMFSLLYGASITDNLAFKQKVDKCEKRKRLESVMTVEKADRQAEIKAVTDFLFTNSIQITDQAHHHFDPALGLPQIVPGYALLNAAHQIAVQGMAAKGSLFYPMNGFSFNFATAVLPGQQGDLSVRILKKDYYPKERLGEYSFKIEVNGRIVAKGTERFHLPDAPPKMPVMQFDLATLGDRIPIDA